MICVDVNVIAYLLIAGDKTELAQQAWAKDPQWRLPSLWRHELLNVLAAYVRSGGESELLSHASTGSSSGGNSASYADAISPDGRFALFWSQREGSAAGDIYAVRRVGDGWDSQAIRLPSPINSAGFDFTPAFSADGTLLRFASDRAPSGLPETGPGAGGLSDIYAVPVETILAALGGQ